MALIPLNQPIKIPLSEKFKHARAHIHKHEQPPQKICISFDLYQDCFVVNLSDEETNNWGLSVGSFALFGPGVMKGARR